MSKKKATKTQQRDLPKPGKQYPGVHGKIVMLSVQLRPGSPLSNSGYAVKTFSS